VFPEEKELLVRILQSRRHAVAIVGDWIRDSPALKIANCGIATDKASASARFAADMIQFNQGGLGLLIQAIQISRQTLEQSYNYLFCETVVVLQCLGLWSMWSYNFMTSSDPPLNLWWLILHLNLSDMLWLSSFGFEANTLPLNKPSKWKRWEVSNFILSVYITFALGAPISSSLSALTRSTGISLHATHNNFAKWSAQNIWLFSIITGHPQYVFVRTQDRFWS
jgi:magnesium-transporting ATPase (P-type)